MGIELAQLRDRIIGAYRLRDAGSSSDTGAAMYRLEKMKSGWRKVMEVAGLTGSSESVGQEPQEPCSDPQTY